MKPAHELSALGCVELHELTFDRRDATLSQRIVLLGATSGTLEPRLFCFSDRGRSGPRSVFSSRMLYRKKRDK